MSENKETLITGKFKLSYILITVLIIALQSFVFQWLYHSRDSSLRDSLLHQSKLISKSINVQRIKNLTGSVKDLVSKDYLRLKEQLKLVRSAQSGCRFVYIMGQNSKGEVFFFVDSETPESSDYSPPGLIYEEATELNRNVFSTRNGVIEGPINDRWGIWISSLVPIIDPETGNAIALLGMDMDAKNWKWEVISGIVFPVFLILFLNVGGLFYFSNKYSEKIHKPINKKKIFLTGILLILISTATIILVWKQTEKKINIDFRKRIELFNQGIQESISHQTKSLTIFLQSISNNNLLRELLKNHDAKKIYEEWLPLYKKVQSTYELDEFVFYDSERYSVVNFDKADETKVFLNCYTIRETDKTGKTSSGIEILDSGELCLRIIQPVLEENKVFGYLLAGRSFQRILERKSTSGLEIALVILKENINPETWNKGIEINGKKMTWQKIPGGIIRYSSHSKMPEPFIKIATDVIAQEIALGEEHTDVKFGEMEWRVIPLPLKDASGKIIGFIQVMIDITNEKKHLLKLITIYGFSLVIFLMLISWVLFISIRQR